MRHRNPVLALVTSLSMISVAHADPCDVKVVRAPDGVRETIRRWVAAEPACSGALEVRIVETPDGLYLFARDDRGRVHERTVPDADSAGVLIASWAADDSMVPPSIFDVAPTIADEDSVAVTHDDDDKPDPIVDSASGGGTIEVADATERSKRAFEVRADVASAVVRAPQERKRWLTLAALVGKLGAAGVRAELDVWTTPKWSIGVAGQLSSDESTLPSIYQTTIFDDRQLVVYAARTFRGRNWSARLAGAVGIVASQGMVDMWDRNNNTHVTAAGTFKVWEWSFLVARTVGKRWEATLGPVVQHHDQTYDAMATTIVREDVVVSVLGGFRYRL